MPQQEHHVIQRAGWLRASVLGANDGVISTASLLVGVAAGGASEGALLLTGVAAMAAGALSMAAGEFVSVSSQSDIETTDAKIEAAALKAHPAAELEELTDIYVARGVEPATARAVAEQLTANDALGAHLRDELGIVDATTARPGLAAVASAASFAAGAALPLLAAVAAPVGSVEKTVAAASLASLALLGALAARAAKAPIARTVLRVTIWGAAAMAVTALIGRAFNVAV